MGKMGTNCSWLCNCPWYRTYFYVIQKPNEQRTENNGVHWQRRVKYLIITPQWMHNILSFTCAEVFTQKLLLMIITTPSNSLLSSFQTSHTNKNKQIHIGRRTGKKERWKKKSLFFFFDPKCRVCFIFVNSPPLLSTPLSLSVRLSLPPCAQITIWESLISSGAETSIWALSWRATVRQSVG